MINYTDWKRMEFRSKLIEVIVSDTNEACLLEAWHHSYEHNKESIIYRCTNITGTCQTNSDALIRIMSEHPEKRIKKGKKNKKHMSCFSLKI